MRRAFNKVYTGTMEQKTLAQVKIIALVEEQRLHSPAVILHDEIENKILPIWLGYPEARAIAIAMQKAAMERPMTHKLIQNITETLGGKIKKIIINKIENNTFHSLIIIESSGAEIEIDSRPSDSIALAFYANVPIFIAKDMITALGQPNPFNAGPKTKFTDEEIKYLNEMLKRAREKEQI